MLLQDWQDMEKRDELFYCDTILRKKCLGNPQLNSRSRARTLFSHDCTEYILVTINERLEGLAFSVLYLSSAVYFLVKHIYAKAIDIPSLCSITFQNCNLESHSIHFGRSHLRINRLGNLFDWYPAAPPYQALGTSSSANFADTRLP